MGRIRRVVLALATAVSLAATATIVGVGAGGGFGSTGGHFVFNDTSAAASFFNPIDNSSASVFVDHSLFLVRPGSKSAPEEMTVLSVFIFVPDVDPTQPPLFDAQGCFVIPDSDFVVSRDLSMATLNATVEASDSCPGFLVPFGDTGPAKGGGGDGGGFTFPLTVTGSWTGTGVIGMSENQGVFVCGGFVSNTHSKTRSEFSASTTVSISGFGTFTGSPPDAFGNVSVGTQTFDIVGTGILPPECGGKGG